MKSSSETIPVKSELTRLFLLFWRIVHLSAVEGSRNDQAPAQKLVSVKKIAAQAVS